MSEYNNLLYKIKKYRKYLNANPNSHNLQYKLNKYNNRLNNLRGGAKPESLVGRIPEDKFTEDNKIKKIDEYINEQLESVDESKREELKSTLKTDLEPILQAIDDNLVSKPAFEKYKEALTDAQEKIVEKLEDILNKIQNLKSAYAEAVQKYYECVVKTKEKTETEEETKPKEISTQTEEAIADCDIKYKALLKVITEYINYKSKVSVGDLNVDAIFDKINKIVGIREIQNSVRSKYWDTYIKHKLPDKPIISLHFRFGEFHASDILFPSPPERRV